MTVQQLIDELQKIPNKNLVIQFKNLTDEKEQPIKGFIYENNKVIILI